MTTYASARALATILLVCNSLLFIVAAYVALCGLVQCIGLDGMGDLPLLQFETVANSTASSSSDDSNDGDDDHELSKDRFPSLGSGGALFFFGCASTALAVLGCVAVQVRSARLLNMYGYCGVLSWFLKFLFIFATVKMHALRPSYDPLSGRLGLLLLLSAICEFVLALSACHLAKVVKRGDAAEPHLHPLPVKAWWSRFCAMCPLNQPTTTAFPISSNWYTSSCHKLYFIFINISNAIQTLFNCPPSSEIICKIIFILIIFIFHL